MSFTRQGAGGQYTTVSSNNGRNHYNKVCIMCSLRQQEGGTRQGWGGGYLEVVHDKGGGLDQGIADLLLTRVHASHHPPHCLQPTPLPFQNTPHV